MQEWPRREEGALAPVSPLDEYPVNPDKPLPWNGDRSSLLSMLALLALLIKQTYRIFQEQGELPLTPAHCALLPHCTQLSSGLNPSLQGEETPAMCFSFLKPLCED